MKNKQVHFRYRNIGSIYIYFPKTIYILYSNFPYPLQLDEIRERHKSTIEEVKHEVKAETERRIERERSSRDGSDASSKDIAAAREIDGLRREVERLKAELVGKG